MNKAPQRIVNRWKAVWNRWSAFPDGNAATLPACGLFLLCFLFVLPSRGELLPGNGGRKEKAFEYAADDSTVISVDLVYGETGRPECYTAHITAGVCSDGLCRPVNVYITWDLLGNFVNYSTPPGTPLTKFDHIEFTEEDHLKLHGILSDKNSLLQDYDASELIDTSSTIHSGVTDAVTSATIPSFAGAIVSGAAYTVHKLWHFVNDGVPDEILAYTEAMLDDSLKHQLLLSGNPVYEQFILASLREEELSEFVPDMIGLIRSKDAYTPHFALEKLPDSVWTDPLYQEMILEPFPELDATVQNALLDRLTGRKLSPASLDLLLGSVGQMDRHQAGKLFGIIEDNLGAAGKLLQDRLSALQADPREYVAKGAGALLARLRE